MRLMKVNPFSGSIAGLKFNLGQRLSFDPIRALDMLFHPTHFYPKIRYDVAPSTPDFLADDAEAGPLGGTMKRCLDIAIALTVLTVFSPLFLMIVAILYATSGRPIFFAHERVGYNGVKFRCYKFRTMVTNASEVLNEHLANDANAAAEWAASQKLANDPRITPLGHLLRKSSLDELPQLFNILAGDMTCVGPRPVVPSELDRYGKSARYYLKTRPGLTGLWQVSGRNGTGYAMRIALDRTYVTEWSLGMDMIILLKTLPAVLRHRESS